MPAVEFVELRTYRAITPLDDVVTVQDNLAQVSFAEVDDVPILPQLDDAAPGPCALRKTPVVEAGTYTQAE